MFCAKFGWNWSSGSGEEDEDDDDDNNNDDDGQRTNFDQKRSLEPSAQVN